MFDLAEEIRAALMHDDAAAADALSAAAAAALYQRDSDEDWNVSAPEELTAQGASPSGVHGWNILYPSAASIRVAVLRLHLAQ